MKLLLAIMVAFLTSVAFAQPPITYEGSLDPSRFNPPEWVVVFQDTVNQEVGMAILENPTCEVAKTIQIFVHIPTSVILQYRYFKDDEFYVFYLDFEANRYRLKEQTPKLREKCRSCHEEKLSKARELF